MVLPRLGRKIMVSSGLAGAAVGMLLLTRVAADSSYLTDIAPGLVLVGIGAGFVFAAGFSGGTVGVSDEDSGVASATINTFQQIGGSFGTALLSTLFATAVQNGIGDRGPGRVAANLAAIDGYSTAFWWSVAIFGVGAVITGLLYRPGAPDLALSGAPVAAH